MPVVNALTPCRQRYIARPVAMPAVLAITLRQHFPLRGIIIGIDDRATATAAAPPPARTLRDDRLGEFRAGTAQVPAWVDDGEGEEAEKHGRRFETVEVGFVGWDWAIYARGELHETEDDARLGKGLVV